MKRSVENWLNNHFGITKREYRGLLVLSGLILLVTGLPSAYEACFPDREGWPVTVQDSIRALGWHLPEGEEGGKFGGGSGQGAGGARGLRESQYDMGAGQRDDSGDDPGGRGHWSERDPSGQRDGGERRLTGGGDERGYPGGYDERGNPGGYDERGNSGYDESGRRSGAGFKGAAPRMFPFDPNTIGAAEWQQLGLSPRQAAVLLKYRQKGGYFRKPGDLQRIYVLSPAMYKKLLPYVRIAVSPGKGALNRGYSPDYGAGGEQGRSWSKTPQGAGDALGTQNGQGQVQGQGRGLAAAGINGGGLTVAGAKGQGLTAAAAKGQGATGTKGQGLTAAGAKGSEATSGTKRSGGFNNTLISVNLNTADTLQLMQLRGIGSVFAKRIYYYRERLGGFYKKEQLFEVFGMDSIRYKGLEKQLQAIDPGTIRKIPVNTAAFEQWRNHPYITYKQINAILQYRKQHGNYKGMDDLKKVLILDAKTIERLSPYLEF